MAATSTYLERLNRESTHLWSDRYSTEGGAESAELTENRADFDRVILTKQN